jgi:IS605 OrfB family transposase
MLTLKLRIAHCDNIDLLNQYITSYTGLFYKLYNNPELLADKSFICSQLNNYIDKSIYDSCIKDVLTKLKQFETNKKKKEKEIKRIEKLLFEDDFNTKKERYNKYKLINKLARLKRNLDKDICFGGKTLLRDITKLGQNKNRTDKQDILLINKKQLFKENRKLGIYLIGRAFENGNRKVDFELDNDNIIFKPNRNTKINIKFHSHSKKLLNTLNTLANDKIIPLTVRIDNEYIYISYDEELINGYSFNINECKKEQKLYDDEDIKKQIYIKYREEQKERKSKDKLVNRYLAFDLNPTNIGLCIFDEIDGNQIFIHKEYIDLSKLNRKLGLSSSDNRQKKQNNKRKHEIKEVWKYIFNLAIYYNVYNICMEDLEFNADKLDSKEANRLTKNMWHLTLTKNLINKYCNIIGLNLVKVNPCYTSFIGNMIHVEYPDSICSSMEIGRRGMTRYKKGCSIYPEIALINQQKLTYLVGENIVISSWQDMYKTISLLRYRNPLKEGLKDNYLYSYKSGVAIYKY